MSNGSYPVGFRFRPTDEELVDYYLKNMVVGNEHLVQCIAKLGDICDYEPWDLPRFSIVDSEDQQWYFIYSPNYKYKESKRVNRVTKAGFWKVTGKTRNVTAKNDTKNVIGKKRTLVFYERSNPNDKGKWTPWVMHEYRLTANLPNQNSFLLVKLKKNDEDEKVDDSNVECVLNSPTPENDLEVLDEAGLGQNGSETYQEQDVYSNFFSPVYPPTQEEYGSSSSWNLCSNDYDMTYGNSSCDGINEEEAEFCNSFLADWKEGFPPEDENDQHHS